MNEWMKNFNRRSCLPPVWNLRAASWIPLSISLLVLLPSPVAISVLSFSDFGPFPISVFP